MKITNNTVTISLKNASVVDQFSFPGGAGNNLGIAGAPATLSFDITYTKSGEPRHVEPTTADRLSPFNWEGEMWTATNSGTFSLAYQDGSFSAQGSFDSAGNFGEMGTERNGSFVDDEHIKDLGAHPDAANIPASPAWPSLAQNQASLPAQKIASASITPHGPKLKGRVPISQIIH
ncbi:MAG TPA: hypothetical protein VE263_11935 [Candidatus Angelobacter sp.]|nr:hypothetical protein [Candidatus Angelobacter sp.]